MKKQTPGYENFSLGLALFDALPVLFFSASMLLIAAGFKNPFFIAGAVLCACSGLFKVLWKIIIATSRKNLFVLNRQMRFLMPLGFLLILIGLITGMSVSKLNTLISCVISFPAVLFFAITVIGMCLMGVFAARLDSTKVRSNWIEQITNAIAQGCLFIGVLLCLFR